MALLSRKSTTPSHEERLGAAAAKAGAALSIFHEAAADLEAAAEEQLVIEAELSAEIDRLEDLAVDAAANAASNQDAALRVRSLFG